MKSTMEERARMRGAEGFLVMREGAMSGRCRHGESSFRGLFRRHIRASRRDLDRLAGVCTCGVYRGAFIPFLSSALVLLAPLFVRVIIRTLCRSRMQMLCVKTLVLQSCH